MSFCVSRSLARSFRVLPLLVAAATSLAFAPAASAQSAAPKKEGPAKPSAKAKKADPKTAPAPAATPAASTAATTTPPADGAQPTETEAPKEEEKERSRAIYLSLDIGFARADIGGFSDATGFDKTGANGLLAGVGVGYRYKGFRIGGRFRDTATTEYSLWSLMGEIGYGLPIRPISPIFMVHAGYMFDVGVERAVIASSLPRGNVLPPDIDLNGVVVGGELSAMYWFTSFLRLGPFIGFDATVLSRSQANLPQSTLPISDETRSKPLFSDSGSGLGYMLSIGLRGTGDIAF